MLYCYPFMRHLLRQGHQSRQRKLGNVGLLLSAILLCEGMALAADFNIFASFTLYIQRHVQEDLSHFQVAETCTNWFYREKFRKPNAPAVVFIAFHPDASLIAEPSESTECPEKYPGGLDQAREDFTRNQARLSVSMTAYEFAVLGDKNDDGRYSGTELEDVLQSLGIKPADLPNATAQAAALTAKFDRIRETNGLELVVNGMQTLYDKGYRVTDKDRAALEHLSK